MTGLAILELFKMVLGKDIGDFRARLIGFAANVLTSFEPGPPKTKTSGTKLTEPDPSTLGPGDFDAQGKVKKTPYAAEVFAAYPDQHSCWEKLVVQRTWPWRSFARGLSRSTRSR